MSLAKELYSDKNFFEENIAEILSEVGIDAGCQYDLKDEERKEIHSNAENVLKEKYGENHNFIMFHEMINKILDTKI